MSSSETTPSPIASTVGATCFFASGFVSFGAGLGSPAFAALLAAWAWLGIGIVIESEYFSNHRRGVYKLIAIVKLRDEMVRFLPGSKLLPPTRMDGNAIAGFQAKPKTWIAEGDNFLGAYHNLYRKVVG
jgi:hypothetical protein